MSESALIPVEQRTVEFYGDEITAVRLENGHVYVPIRPLVEALGLAWSSQLQRIRRDPVLKTELFSVFVTNTESQRGGRDVQCLPLDYISGFLFGINADRVRPDLRDRVIRYQRECYKVLAEAFTDGRLTADPDFATILTQVDEGAAQAYQIAAAVYQIARNQVMLEARLTGRMDSHEARLEAIESQLGAPDHVITQSQAMQISQAVKAVAIAYGKQTGKNEFGGVYGELYRKFEIASYKALPAVKFDDCMKWLTEWHQGLVNENPF